MMMFGTYVSEDDAITGRGERSDGVFSEGKSGPQMPFQDVFLHGLVRDQFGKKMSKSRGNGIDPLDWVDRFGADALRFTLARGANPGSDLSVGEDHAQSSRNFATKLFNATKFALMNGAAPAPLPGRGELTDADRWILDRLEQVRGEVDAAFDRYEFSKACEALFHFAWDEVCDWYLELAKVQFAENDTVAANTRAVLGNVLDALLRLLHPVIPFVTETLWKALTENESVVVADWPQSSETAADAVAAQRVEDMQRLVTEVRRFRSDQGLKPSQRVPRGSAALPSRSGHAARRGHVAGASDGPGGRFRGVRVGGGALEQGDRHRRSRHVGQRRPGRREGAAGERSRGRAEGTRRNHREAVQRGVPGQAPDAVKEKIRTRQQIATEEIERITKRLKELEGA